MPASSHLASSLYQVPKTERALAPAFGSATGGALVVIVDATLAPANALLCRFGSALTRMLHVHGGDGDDRRAHRGVR